MRRKCDSLEEVRRNALEEWGGSVPFFVVHSLDSFGLGFGEGSPELGQVTNQTKVVTAKKVLTKRSECFWCDDDCTAKDDIKDLFDVRFGIIFKRIQLDSK